MSTCANGIRNKTSWLGIKTYNGIWGDKSLRNSNMNLFANRSQPKNKTYKISVRHDDELMTFVLLGHERVRDIKMRICHTKGFSVKSQSLTAISGFRVSDDLQISDMKSLTTLLTLTLNEQV
jgi:hypothetical protein